MSGNQKQAVLFVVLLCLDLCICMDTVPICAYDLTNCHILSVSNLFDRVIQHSGRMHGLSSDLYSELEQDVWPGKNYIGKVYRKCHTSSMITPKGKENAQNLPLEGLTKVILKLLMAWRSPLSQLYQSISQQQDFTRFNINKVLEMSDMVHELRKGVEKIVEKMKLLGLISNSVNDHTSPDDVPPAFDSREAVSDYELLYCFRRDSDKVQNYLKILKCRILPEHGC